METTPTLPGGRDHGRDNADFGLARCHNAGAIGADAGACRGRRQKATTRIISATGMCSVRQITRRMTSVGRFFDGIGGESRRHSDQADIGVGRLHGVADGIKDRLALEPLTALPGRYAADDIGAVLHHQLGVESHPAGR